MIKMSDTNDTVMGITSILMLKPSPQDSTCDPTVDIIGNTRLLPLVLGKSPSPSLFPAPPLTDKSPSHR